MRVLWFTNTPSNYKSQSKGYNGGGWIASAEKAISENKDIDLAVAFEMKGEPFKSERNGVSYYPIDIQGNRIESFFNRLRFALGFQKRNKWDSKLEKLKTVIEDFQPDVIHVWGSEQCWGLVASVTQVPVVLHLQGILNPYLNSYLPPFVSWGKYSFGRPFSVKRFLHLGDLVLTKYRWKLSVAREQEIFSRVHYFMGRTDWDKRVTFLLNPESEYFYCSEFLRDAFYLAGERLVPQKLTIVTTISSPLYKGFDLVLKTAKLLKYNLNLDFDWLCFGDIDPIFQERLTGIKHSDVNVRLCGVATQSQLIDVELNATCYVHTSYIDNSPNSLCEAQMLGLPCISTNVGGISSLIEEGNTGFLVPANDPYQLAYLIRLLYMDKELNRSIGLASKRLALKRHDKDSITCRILDVYNDILSKKAN